MMRKINTGHISINFVSRLKFTEFCAYVLTYLKNSLGLDEDTFFNIEIALREVINNAIIHGNKSDLNKRVYIVFKWTRSKIVISVKDENQTKIDMGKIEERIQKKSILSFSGRGIILMKSYMDKVEFFPSETGTKVVMEKKF